MPCPPSPPRILAPGVRRGSSREDVYKRQVLMNKFTSSLRRFMYGRYGVDNFSQALVVFSLVLSFLGLILDWKVLAFLCYLPLIDVYKRQGVYHGLWYCEDDQLCPWGYNYGRSVCTLCIFISACLLYTSRCV